MTEVDQPATITWKLNSQHDGIRVTFPRPITQRQFDGWNYELERSDTIHPTDSLDRFLGVVDRPVLEAVQAVLQAFAGVLQEAAITSYGTVVFRPGMGQMRPRDIRYLVRLLEERLSALFDFDTSNCEGLAEDPAGKKE